MIILIYLILAAFLVALLLGIRSSADALGALVAKAQADERARRIQHVSIRDLADATQERIDCGCRFWNGDADRAEWIPCGTHLEELIRDVKSS